MTMPDGRWQATSLFEGIAAAATDGAAFSSGHIDAAGQSGRLWAAGLQELGQRGFGAAQDMGDRFQATVRALSSAKSVRETLNIQASHLSTEVEQSMKRAADLQEAALRLVQQTSAPLVDHLTTSSAAVTARGFES